MRLLVAGLLLSLAACATTQGAAQTCPSPIRADPRKDARGSCSFTAGARVKETLGVTDDERKAIPIQHVVVVMEENRSFDHYLGKLSQSGHPDVEPVPPNWSSLGFASEDDVQAAIEGVAAADRPCFKTRWPGAYTIFKRNGGSW